MQISLPSLGVSISLPFVVCVCVCVCVCVFLCLLCVTLSLLVSIILNEWQQSPSGPAVMMGHKLHAGAEKICMTAPLISPATILCCHAMCGCPLGKRGGERGSHKIEDRA